MLAIAMLLGGGVLAAFGLAAVVLSIYAVTEGDFFAPHAGGFQILIVGLPLLVVGVWAVRRGRARYRALAESNSHSNEPHAG
jgi:hypothetical protein